MVRRTAFIVALVTVLIGVASLPAIAQSGRTFYIDYAAGSNSNSGASEASPWKSNPYMNHGAGCDGGMGPNYAHQAGDKFIFKGGSTWPAACFTMNITDGGTSTARMYFGVCLNTDPDSPCYGGTSWPSSGWTQPLWDMNYTRLSFVVFVNSGVTGYMTWDNIEIAHQGIILTGSDSNGVAFGMFYGATGTILENMYIHDWATTDNVSTSPTLLGYDYGAIYNYNGSRGNNITLKNSTISDASGYFYSNGTKINGGFGGACEECTEVSGSVFHDVSAACFDMILCHDSEFYNIDAVGIYNYDGGVNGLHTQAIEDDGGNTSTDYNNYIHDSLNTGIMVLICAGSSFFNNVMSNTRTGQYPLFIDTNCSFNTSSATQQIYNNTIDGTTAGACVRLGRSGATIGTVTMRNNIFISSSGSCSVDQFATVTNFSNTNFRQMTGSEASTYGFTAATKYSPTSSDPDVTGQGATLLSLASGTLSALALDAAGAPWHGGSYNARTTTWDLGAFVTSGLSQLSSSSSSKPNPPTNLTASVQ